MTEREGGVTKDERNRLTQKRTEIKCVREINQGKVREREREREPLTRSE